MNANLLFFQEHFVAIAGVLGLIVGSFLNVVILRLPVMLEREWAAQLPPPAPPPSASEPFNLLTPGSRCPVCHQPIRAWHNVPVLSFVLLRGKCAHCRTAISWRYPAIELLSGLLSAGLAAHFGPGWQGAASLLLAWTLIALAIIDLNTHLLPDLLTQPLLWAGLLINLNGTFVPLEAAVLGAAIGYLVLWSVYWIFKMLTGKEGMGYGDFKLLAALGAWLGWSMLLPIILLSSLAGAVIGVVLLVVRRHGRDVPIPFGPYLAIAGLIALVQGTSLLTALGWR
jgi:leader peptidase (prepilin peptidase)/N-methyltransferase